MYTYRRVYLVIVSTLMLGVLNDDVSAQCNQQAVTLRETKVYDRAPAFYTGSGWKTGNLVHILPTNTTITICELIEIGLFLDKKTWYRIQYNNSNGWVFSNDLKLTLNENTKFRISSSSFNFVSVAYAQSKDKSEDNPLPSSVYSLIVLYVSMFFITLLGMVGKVVFDEIDKLKEISFKNCLKTKKCIKAIIVAPIIFLAFLKTADFTSSAEIMSIVITGCIAFQNGFFWQTVLPTELRKK